MLVLPSLAALSSQALVWVLDQRAVVRPEPSPHSPLWLQPLLRQQDSASGPGACTLGGSPRGGNCPTSKDAPGPVGPGQALHIPEQGSPERKQAAACCRPTGTAGWRRWSCEMAGTWAIPDGRDAPSRRTSHDLATRDRPKTSPVYPETANTTRAVDATVCDRTSSAGGHGLVCRATHVSSAGKSSCDACSCVAEPRVLRMNPVWSRAGTTTSLPGIGRPRAIGSAASTAASGRSGVAATGWAVVALTMTIGGREYRRDPATALRGFCALTRFVAVV